MHHPHNMCEDDIQALHRLEQIFKQAAENNKEVGIKNTTPRPTPRVAAPQQSATPSKEEQQKLLTNEIAEIVAQPRAKETIFTPISNSAPSLRVTPRESNLIVACPRAVVVSEEGANQTINQEEEPKEDAIPTIT